ncbi:tetratricopeptide repeat protein [Aquimarina brevivitae]|uniref:Tetratricopeptide repeat protein n=1 Tax=Aquimarina brevivitae TaxID=323412 RepID=A0A4Q7P1E3_9FLAO|nr:tetratricopeptide repeat protein [Aquimarina brevivitae]RZS93190.1 tetratricopeptide repeat protein [Aquimarina brevivitae]
MEKLHAYILSLLLISILTSCNTNKNPFQDLSADEKTQKIKSFEYAKATYFQGSLRRQKYFDSLIQLNPSNHEYYKAKSMSHSKIGDYHLAFPLLQEAMKLNPKETLYYTSWLMSDLYKDYDRALSYLNQYDAYTPGKTDYAWGENVNFLKGEVLQALGRHEEAIEEFTKAIEVEGDFIDYAAFVYRGISYDYLGQFEKALQDYDSTLQIYDKSSMAYYYRALTLVKLNKKEEAVKNLNKALDLIKLGYKKSDPYKEVYNEIYQMQVVDKLAELQR